MNKVTLGVFSDQHCNSTVGLISPLSYMDDGQTIIQSPGQAWLWDCCVDFTSAFHRMAEGGEKIAIMVGDALELDTKKRGTQTMVQDEAQVKENAFKTFAPFVEPCDRSFWIRGTAAHGGPSAHAESSLALMFKNCERTIAVNNRRPIWWELQARFGGVLFDFSHHTTGDARPWTRNGAMTRLITETIVRCSEMGDPIPRYAIRAHMHQYRDTFEQSPICRAITLPAFSLATEFVYRLGKPGVSDIGGLIITIEDGNVDILVKRYPFKKELRPVWEA